MGEIKSESPAAENTSQKHSVVKDGPTPAATVTTPEYYELTTTAAAFGRVDQVKDAMKIVKDRCGTIKMVNPYALGFVFTMASEDYDRLPDWRMDGNGKWLDGKNRLMVEITRCIGPEEAKAAARKAAKK